MFTKPLVHQSITILDEETKDSNSINRLLAAAAISPRFRASLLSDPHQAIQVGFGGERFPLSSSTFSVISSIKAPSLPEFVRQMEEKLGHRS